MGRLTPVFLAVASLLWFSCATQAQPHQRGAWAAREGAQEGSADGSGQGRPFRRRRFEDAGDGASAAGEPGTRLSRARNLDGQNPAFGSERQPGRQPGAGARQGGQGLAGGRRFGAPINLQKLGLSDEQKQKIRELRGRNSGRAKELRESLRAKRNEMRDLMFDPAATEAQIRSARRELRRMQDQMEEMQIDDFLSMRSVLTPEQRKRLPEIMPRPGGGQQQGVGPPQLPASVSDGSSGN